MLGQATRLHKLSIPVAFSLTIVVLVLGMFMGVWRVLANLSRTPGRGTTAEAFQTPITGALTLLVVFERLRTFSDCFEWQRVRIHVLLCTGTIFLLRELIVKLYPLGYQGLEVVGWAAGILLLMFTHTLAVRWPPPRHPREEAAYS